MWSIDEKYIVANEKTACLDELIALPDNKLADHIQLEIFATGNDVAEVKEWVEQRRSFQTDTRRMPTEIRVVEEYTCKNKKLML